jgi:myo-inositol-1(or 4)-monophosphatase
MRGRRFEPGDAFVNGEARPGCGHRPNRTDRGAIDTSGRAKDAPAPVRSTFPATDAVTLLMVDSLMGADVNLDSREAFCMTVITEAGAIALRRFGDRAGLGTTMKGRQDFLTEADGEVERLLAARVREKFPGDGFLGEEGGGADADRLWVVDPIDGTANFARGIPHFCVAIAFVQYGQTELGAIFNPATNELFFARRGRGATMNGRPMAVSSTIGFDAATVEIGWSTRVANADYLRVVAATLERDANVRRGGSGCLGVAYVADGRIDAYVELHSNAWDCLAGMLMVEEAGGRVSPFLGIGALLEGAPVLAAAPGVAEAMSAITGIPLLLSPD